ncbi:TPA: hypothetical protein DD448_00490 [Candidatus Collierbacteria bacterium]|nr:hypothetical protein [Candidatus Collierbacteria bacterium]
MFKDILDYPLDYLFLAVLSGAYLITVFLRQTAPYSIFLATSLFVSLYFLWGIIHHLHAKSLHGRVVLEYFLVSALGIVIVSTLLI